MLWSCGHGSSCALSRRTVDTGSPEVVVADVDCELVDTWSPGTLAYTDVLGGLVLTVATVQAKVVVEEVVDGTVTLLVSGDAGMDFCLYFSSCMSVSQDVPHLFKLSSCTRFYSS